MFQIIVVQKNEIYFMPNTLLLYTIHFQDSYKKWNSCIMLSCHSKSVGLILGAAGKRASEVAFTNSKSRVNMPELLHCAYIP
jgi:hypothetical protein